MGTWCLWIAGVAALAVAGWQLRRPSELSLARLVSVPLVLVTGVGLLIPATFGLLSRISFIFRGLEAIDGGVTALALLLGAAWVGFGVWLVLGAPRRLSDRGFLILVGGLLLAARFTFLLTTTMEPGDDFAKMWAQAGALSETFEVPPPQTSPDDHSNALQHAYFERTLPYLLPLRLLFGESAMAYRSANALILLATSLLAFWLGRRWFGSEPARCAFVASQLAPETWIAQLLPTHDIPGAFLTFACIALAVLLWDRTGEDKIRWRPVLGLVVALPITLEILDLQRTNAAPFLLAWILVSGAAAIAGWLRNTERRPWLRIAVCLLPVFGFVAVEAALLHGGLLRPPGIQKERKLKKIAAFTDSWGSGSSNHWKADWVRRPLEDGNWGHVMRRKLLTDTALHPEQRIALTVRKSSLLYDLGSQSHFYIRGGTLPWIGEVRRTDERRYRQANSVYVIAFLGLLVTGALLAWHRAGIVRIEHFPLVYLCILSAVLVYTFETQPRYLFQIWTLGALYLRLPAAPSPAEGELDD